MGRNGLLGFDLEELTDELRGYLGRIAEAAVELRKMVEQSLEGEDYTWLVAAGDTGAATDVEVTVPAPFQGSAFLLGQVAVTGGVGGPCAIYFDRVSTPTLVAFIDNAQIFSDNMEIYVPEGRSLVFHFYDQPNDQACTVSVQAKQLIQP